MCVTEGEVVFGPPLFLLLSFISVAFYHSGFYTSLALKMEEGQGWAQSTFLFPVKMKASALLEGPSAQI